MILKLSWPAPALWPNRANGKHWTAKHKAKVAAREAGFYAVRSSKDTSKLPDGPIPLSLVFCASTARRFDVLEVAGAMKASIDGIAKALGIDDSRFAPVVLNRGVVGKPGCVIVGVGVEAA